MPCWAVNALVLLACAVDASAVCLVIWLALT